MSQFEHAIARLFNEIEEIKKRLTRLEKESNDHFANLGGTVYVPGKKTLPELKPGFNKFEDED